MSQDSAPLCSYSINSDLERTNPAPIALAKAWSTSYSGEHGPVLLLTQGVPALPPDKAFLTRLGEESVNPANTVYGSWEGVPELREALAADIQNVYKTKAVTADNIAIVAGCNLAAQMAIQTVAQAGDEVILPSPWYFNHEMCLDMLGISLIPLPCQHSPKDGGFVPTVDDAKRLLSDKTKAIILVTPNNPTGSIYSSSLIQSFYTLCKEHGIALLLDETYRNFVTPSEEPIHTLFDDPDWDQTVISLYSFSKAYAIPGHRVGAIIASQKLLNKQTSKVIDTSLVCAPMAAQKTVAWAIDDAGQKQWRAERAEELLNRGKLFTQVINQANATISQERGEGENSTWQGWTIDGLGGYYAFLRNPYLEEGIDQTRLGQLLAAEVGVVVLPGSFFGQGVRLDTKTGKRVKEDDTRQAQHLRVSIANILDDGIRKLEDRFVAFDRLIRQGKR